MGDEVTLVMDIGQTGMRARIRVGDKDGDDVRELTGVRNDLPLMPQVASTVAELIADFGVSPTGLALGSTGLPVGHAGAELGELVAPLGIARVALAHDSVTGFLGALHFERGAVVAGGTGTVTLGVGEESVVRVDGWGNQLGDAGAGFWIGRAGLEMVMRDFDGRGPTTALRGIVEQDFPNLADAYVEIQQDPRWVARIASYAKTICGLAATDEVCRSITEGAANEMAYSIATALRRVGEDKQLTTYVSTQGKLFRSTALRARFNSAVHDLVPGAQVVKPLGDGLAGAGLLFDVPDEHPMRTQITYVG